MLKFLAVSILCAFSALANAQTFTVMSDDDFPPYSYQTPDGDVTGIDIDIIAELGRRLDVNFEIELAPFKRMLLLVEKGQRFGAFSLFKTAKREHYGLYTHPVHYSTYKLFTKAEKPLRFDRLQDLYNKRIGVQAGFAISDGFDQATEAGQIQRIDIFSYEDSFNRLVKGGIDAFVVNDMVMQYKLFADFRNRYDYKDFRFIDQPVSDARGAYFVLSKAYQGADMPMWQEKIRKALAKMEAEGFYDKVISRYSRMPANAP